MYLSRVRFLPGNTTHNALLTIQRKGSYASHQLLWQLFTEQQRSFLFREEQSNGLSSQQGMPEYLVLSQAVPVLNTELFQVETKLFAPKLNEGDKLAFRLRANPTRSSKTEDSTNKRGQRHDVMMHAKKCAQAEGVTEPLLLKQRMEQAALDWLVKDERAAGLGVRFDVRPLVMAYSQHKTSKKAQQPLISYSTVDYEGVLTVIDPELLISQVATGIGRAKAFGCGLMLLRRV
ncbi:MAG: type I-E CRISPR-associated protein Cas6/Cse3/CasE [Gammaproteobacteria bacterium]|nr:type I-E CRISPR-associated protein Cas6/Cse3/CasE [Gammaproteobacteria bacterium]MBU2057120.1 type I-E CRISPR-associated protein Cas6/Cse3/CasE [Gammaproteobacteria bacterium]MBU2175179.1 type I-E CRISPR-associated protein Cas6/Cse3/CasE [Gammaproteobacteria bacterium]MBU2245210.1 type I-E CRISPR-associated protein Cas6/Cse3/CasE [Gammaproteobacteria bacterium]MBU2343060.1 type I-E CRISPR-associated protein Cas6/Cse3/CasE [Gammaproteobacteria bacterium]